MGDPVVVDTSVLIGALIGPTGSSREVLRHCLPGNYTPLISNALFLGYEAVAGRGGILAQCPLMCFRALAASGGTASGLEILDKLDAHFRS